MGRYRIVDGRGNTLGDVEADTASSALSTYMQDLTVYALEPEPPKPRLTDETLRQLARGHALMSPDFATRTELSVVIEDAIRRAIAIERGEAE